ncbi:hypothetical protein [Caldisericum sp.]|uniref:hypothetical protein n=1 Tax=Caldisericum sp. TaxID=2499687 RepID=UPI003D10E54E
MALEEDIGEILKFCESYETSNINLRYNPKHKEKVKRIKKRYRIIYDKTVIFALVTIRAYSIWREKARLGSTARALILGFREWINELLLVISKQKSDFGFEIKED